MSDQFLNRQALAMLFKHQKHPVISTLIFFFITVSVNAFSVTENIDWKKVINTHNTSKKEKTSIVLGSGGFGTAYQIQYENKNYVLKTTLINGLEENFIDPALEFKTVKHIPNHANLALPVSNASTPRYVYTLYQYAEGMTLKNYIKNNPNLSAEKKLKLMDQLLSAADHLHQNNVVHLDIKPDNIIISPDGNKLKLIDFGLSLEMDTIGHDGGTASYMAPEQYNNIPKSRDMDIYAMGGVFYFIETGKNPTFKHLEKIERASTTLSKIEALKKQSAQKELFDDLPEDLRHAYGITDDETIPIAPDLESIKNDEFRDLMTAMMAEKPEKRPSISTLSSKIKTLVSNLKTPDIAGSSGSHNDTRTSQGALCSKTAQIRLTSHTSASRNDCTINIANDADIDTKLEKLEVPLHERAKVKRSLHAISNALPNVLDAGIDATFIAISLAQGQSIDDALADFVVSLADPFGAVTLTDTLFTAMFPFDIYPQDLEEWRQKDYIRAFNSPSPRGKIALTSSAAKRFVKQYIINPVTDTAKKIDNFVDEKITKPWVESFLGFFQSIDHKNTSIFSDLGKTNPNEFSKSLAFLASQAFNEKNKSQLIRAMIKEDIITLNYNYIDDGKTAKFELLPSTINYFNLSPQRVASALMNIGGTETMNVATLTNILQELGTEILKSTEPGFRPSKTNHISGLEFQALIEAIIYDESKNEKITQTDLVNLIKRGIISIQESEQHALRLDVREELLPVTTEAGQSVQIALGLIQRAKQGYPKPQGELFLDRDLLDGNRAPITHLNGQFNWGGDFTVMKTVAWQKDGSDIITQGKSRNGFWPKYLSFPDVSIDRIEVRYFDIKNNAKVIGNVRLTPSNKSRIYELGQGGYPAYTYRGKDGKTLLGFAGYADENYIHALIPLFGHSTGDHFQRLVNECLSIKEWTFGCELPAVNDMSLFLPDAPCACKGRILKHKATGLYRCESLPDSCGKKATNVSFINTLGYSPNMAWYDDLSPQIKQYGQSPQSASYHKLVTLCKKTSWEKDLGYSCELPVATTTSQFTGDCACNGRLLQHKASQLFRCENLSYRCGGVSFEKTLGYKPNLEYYHAIGTRYIPQNQLQ